MKNLIKDRKILSLVLCLVLVSVFTLTIAYSALSAVLTIQGNARVSAADWDIYLNNPRVTSGSATTNVPEIKTSSTLEFSTTLNMPGDFYEFVVDVVNGGSIDAMIENVVKNPELTTEQAKYLKYEITYQNGESISNQQLLAKNTTMPIKVRIEYRKDLVASDLPSTNTTLNMSLTLEYTQSNGNASSVPNNGVAAAKVLANGDINEIGTIVTIGTEQFYTIGTEGNNVKMLAMYNLYVGNESFHSEYSPPVVNELKNPTGLQNSIAIGAQYDENGERLSNCYATVAFSSDTQKGDSYTDYSGSIVEIYVNEYKNKIEIMGVSIEEARLISYDEITNEDTFGCVEREGCSNKYPWIYSTSYWIDGVDFPEFVLIIDTDGFFGGGHHLIDYTFGVRPVIVISKDYFN